MIKSVSKIPQWSIICVSGLFWDEHWSNNQQLMSRFAKCCRVLYVERPVSLLSFLTGMSDTSIVRQLWRWLRGGIRVEGENLFILTPPPFFPFRYRPITNRINQKIRLNSIKRAAAKLGMKNSILWIIEPDAYRLVGKLNEMLSLYFCADDWNTMNQWWNRGEDILRLETQLAESVDLLVGTSTKIVEKWTPINPNTYFVPNAADVELFLRTRTADLSVPSEVMRIPSPRIGYIGVVNARFDVNLYDRLSDIRPDWQWVIVGRVLNKQVDVSCLTKKPNVHFLGARPKDILPNYLKGFDVCTIPYILNAHAQSIFPLKLFEYLAAGKPVVATPLFELLHHTKYVRIAATSHEFAGHIDNILKNNPIPAPLDFLEQNSWDARVELLSSVIAQACSPHA